jgi:hypothetical protein
MPEFPQFFYRRVNGNLVCKKTFDAASSEELRRQGFKFSAELWPAVATGSIGSLLSVGTFVAVALRVEKLKLAGLI